MTTTVPASKTAQSAETAAQVGAFLAKGGAITKVPAKAPVKAKPAKAAQPAKAPKADPAPKVDGAPAIGKNAAARVQVAKPQAKMLRTISKIGKHPGKALRIKRFADYKTGMTLQHCKETAGLDHLDVLFYVEHGLMELRDATAKEVEAAVAAWQASGSKE